jgi:hypothetical protein
VIRAPLRRPATPGQKATARGCLVRSKPYSVAPVRLYVVSFQWETFYDVYFCFTGKSNGKVN